MGGREAGWNAKSNYRERRSHSFTLPKAQSFPRPTPNVSRIGGTAVGRLVDKLHSLWAMYSFTLVTGLPS